MAELGVLKLDLADFRKLAAALEQEAVSIKAASAMVGITEQTFHNYVDLSRRGDPRLLIDYPEGDTPRHWCDIVTQCRRRSLINLEAHVRDLCLNGYHEVLRNPQTGQILWEEDPDFHDADPELVKAGIIDRWLRDADGNRIACKKKVMPPAHLVIKVLSAAVPGYQDQRTVTNLNYPVSGPTLANGSDTNKVQAIKQIVRADSIEFDDEPPQPEFLDTKPVTPLDVNQPTPLNQMGPKELLALAKMSAEERMVALAKHAPPVAKPDATPLPAKFDSRDKDWDDGKDFGPGGVSVVS